MQNRALPAAFQLRSRPSCTSRAHKAETQCTRGAQRQRSRCQQQRYNAAWHRQSYTLPYSALARQSACMLVLLAPGSDRDERPHAGQLQTSSAQATAHEQDQHAASKHKNGRGARRRLASAADNNLMSSAELEERRQPTLVSPSRTRSLRGSEAPECRAAGATGRRARHSRGGIRFMAFVAVKVRACARLPSSRRSCVGFLGSPAPKRNDSRPKLAELSPKLESSRRELSNDTLTVEELTVEVCLHVARGDQPPGDPDSSQQPAGSRLSGRPTATSERRAARAMGPMPRRTERQKMSHTSHTILPPIRRQQVATT